ncbi:hypothetical protein CSAL01_02749 [Colletotrichum salicis]|uniref:Uncharacterized protein n=1 Tax=Colletotrichum salicis TaxID=1209931 RepID=A0A135V7C5_9PEZI|nr:hypothetical protein CSAL01_02749 [Colletotrichum salicis]
MSAYHRHKVNAESRLSDRKAQGTLAPQYRMVLTQAAPKAKSSLPALWDPGLPKFFEIEDDVPPSSLNISPLLHILKDPSIRPLVQRAQCMNLKLVGN